MSGLDEFNLSLIKQYCWKTYNEDFEDSMMKTLFERKDYSMILKCLENGFEMNRTIFNYMIESYDLKCYQYLFPHRWDLTSEILQKVYEYGELDLIQWCSELKNPDSGTIELALYRNRLDIVQYLHYRFNIGDPIFNMIFGVTMYRVAIRNGNILFLEWLILNSPQVSSFIYLKLVKDLPTLKWLVEHNFKYYKDTLLSETTDPELIEYIQSLP